MPNFKIIQSFFTDLGLKKKNGPIRTPLWWLKPLSWVKRPPKTPLEELLGKWP